MSKLRIIFGFVLLVLSGPVFLAQAAAKDIYYCPMHPSYRSDRPGTCPICNMNLVKKETGVVEKNSAKDGYAPIILNEHKRQMIGVKTALVEKKEIFRTIRAFGKVARDSRWVYAQIFEYERPFLYTNESPLVGLHHKVTVEVPALPGKIFHGKVRLLERDMDPLTRTTLARITLDNWNKALKEDMSANIYIEVNLGTSLVVPQSAVMDTGLRQVVFVDEGNGIIEPRSVMAGEKGDEDIQIVSGLKEGDRVVVSGNFLIDSESRIKAVLEEADVEQKAAEEHSHGQ